METELRIPSVSRTFPHFETLGASLYVPDDATSTNNIAIILHGHAGHRDYCYQRKLAHSLPIASIRFDFSGCGYQLGSGTKKGQEQAEVPRTIESDLHDLKTVVEYARKSGYFVSALIGHSRGAVVAMQYVKIDHTIPTVVVCSGRFRGHLIHEKVKRNVNLKEGDLGYWEVHRAGTGGDLVEKYVHLSEIASVGDQEMAGIGTQLSPELNVLIVFGSKDNVVPVVDAAMYMNELKHRAELILIEDADHNFFVQPLPEPTAKKINKNGEVAEVITRYLSPEATRLRFLQRHSLLNVPRFPQIQGTSNFRDLGGFGSFPQGLVYRGADLSSITSSGCRELANYISVILDLRSEQEIALNGTIGPRSSEPMNAAGIERLHVPIFRQIDYSPSGISKFFGVVKSERERVANMVSAYKQILNHAKPVFTVLFERLADIIRRRETRGLMIHCSAGKDRTGVLCAMLLYIAHVDPETIALEYELTTFGLTPDKLQHSAVVVDDSKDVHKVASGSTAETMRQFMRYVQQEVDVDAYFASCVPRSNFELVKHHLCGTNKSRL